MKFKIIEGDWSTTKQVFAGIQREEEGSDYILICAWHDIEGEELIQTTEVRGMDMGSMEVFVSFFGIGHATAFIEGFLTPANAG